MASFEFLARQRAQIDKERYLLVHVRSDGKFEGWKLISAIRTFQASLLRTFSLIQADRRCFNASAR